jgi:ankyrin repeat protein
MESWEIQYQRLNNRVFRRELMMPEDSMFAVAEEAVRELAEYKIRSTIDGGDDSIGHEMSEMLRDALRSNDIQELYRASIRLFTMPTTLYRVLNAGIRGYDDVGEWRLHKFEMNWEEAEADPGAASCRWFAEQRRTAPAGSESLAFYSVLLQQALLRWPRRLGKIDVYRGVDLGEDDVDAYRERVGRVVSWVGFASTSRSRRVAERFGTVLFVIHTRDRPDVCGVAALPGEQEVLFGRGTCAFVIEGVTSDPRTGRTVIELKDFQCFQDYAKPLTLEETRMMVGEELRREFGKTEAPVLLDGPVGQERIATSMETRMIDGESLSCMIRLGGLVWRRDRARWAAEMRAAKAEAECRARVDVGMMVDAAGATRPGLTARLIAIGADLEVTNCHGETPLMIAGHRGLWRNVRLLLDAGANAKAVEPGRDLTPLHFAVGSGDVKTLRVLLSADVDVDAMSRAGYTPLLLAVDRGFAAPVALLLRAGADPSRTRARLTPLQLACKLGQLEIASLLLRAGADPTARGTYGGNALEIAIWEGHEAVVRLLLTMVDVEEDGWPSRCFWAVNKGFAEIVQVLLEAGADVTRLNHQGYTLLHEAAMKGSVELTRMMLNAGIHPDDLGGYGMTPMQCCAIIGTRIEGVVDCIRVLIEAGADVSKYGKMGMTALGLAAEQGGIEVVRLLLAAGAPVSLPDNLGRVPLLLAAEHGHADVVEELLEWGARLGPPDVLKRTPLTVAMESGNAEVVRMLRGASSSSDALALANPPTGSCDKSLSRSPTRKSGSGGRASRPCLGGG